MQIKPVAEHIGVDRDTIRRWEREGIIPKAPRNIVGRRIYTPEDVLEIQKIIRERNTKK